MKAKANLVAAKAPMTLKDMQALYLAAKEAYYNSEVAIMSDAQFDKLEDQIKKLAPGWKELKKTGVATKKEKAELPNYMPSLSKCYPEKFPAWITARAIERYLVMDKLDGSSLHLSYLNGKPYALYTRGDGEIGGDISFMLKRLNIPKTIKDKTPRSFRCEAVMSKKNFKKYSGEFDNARNMVNGLFNRKATERVHPAVKDTDIVVLGMFGSLMETGLEHAKAQGFTVVPYAVTADVTNISQALASRKRRSPYEVDGLVVTSVGALFNYAANEKPKWATAFKENADATADKAVVESIIYQVSQHRKIIPKIKIKPLKIDGAMVQYAACHNAKWMMDRKIGPGAVIQILRSGGVIPKIVSVLKPGEFQAPSMPYKLDGVHFVLSDDSHAASTRDAAIQSIAKFLTTLGVEFIADKTIAALYDKGCTTPFHYMKVAHGEDPDPFQRAGLGDVQSQKILAELLKAFKDTPLIKLMVASNAWGEGVGSRRLELIQAAGITMEKLLGMSPGLARSAILRIPGFKDKTADMVIAGIKPFLKFRAVAQKYITVKDVKPKAKKVVIGALSGVNFSFTGYRSAEEESAIEQLGGTIVPYGSKTQVLLYRPTGKPSAKVAAAKAKGLKVMQFKDRNLL